MVEAGKKILFVVGSFEPGKDGVGDYTSIIANQCVKEGLSCAILAFNDVFCVESSVSMNIGSIELLKLKAGLNFEVKREICHPFIQSFNPDLVSVQLVCYAFQKRGWIFNLGKELKSLFPNTIFQVTVHEIWLGFAINHSWKEKLRGFIQKRALKKFFLDLKPVIVHTGNNIYYSILNTWNLNLFYLPLPSNIAINQATDFELISRGLSAPVENRNNYLVGILFGSIQGSWDVREVLNKLLFLAGNRKLVLMSVGKQGFGNVIWDEIEKEWSSKIILKKWGFASDNQISDLLQYSDFGICTTPLSLLGKSGTTMAMIEHGLPVAVTRNELKYNFPILNVEDKYPMVHMWDCLKAEDLQIKYPDYSNRLTELVNLYLDKLPLH